MNKRLQFLVTLHHGQWEVLLANYYGPYSEMDAAITNAVDAAQLAGKNGSDSEVLLSLMELL